MNRPISRLSVVLLICLSFLSIRPLQAIAGEATDQVRQTVDAVMDVLNNKELKKPEHRELREKKIREIVNKRFDFEEMAKRSLALNWSKRTPEERKEFVTLFSDLLESTYIKKIERYENEKIVYLDEKITGQYAVVRTKIVKTQEAEIPVEYRIFKKADKWEAYDIIVEGVSLVNNYRSQFSQIIRSSSYEELVKKLKNKTLKETK
ncbi:MAG: phospholipid-binding protein MlaC [Thermodesulfovibrionales bacterium]